MSQVNRLRAIAEQREIADREVRDEVLVDG